MTTYQPTAPLLRGMLEARPFYVHAQETENQSRKSASLAQHDLREVWVFDPPRELRRDAVPEVRGAICPSSTRVNACNGLGYINHATLTLM
jgi:hypothetical protein